MPTKEILAKRLCDKDFNHFLEQTKIADQLGGSKLHPLGVCVTVETALYDYSEYVKNPMVAKIMKMRKNQLIATLLEDSPEALVILEKDGAYTSEGKTK